MDPHAVPFPSVSRIKDDMSPERRMDGRTPHGRVNSSPSFPEWPLPLSHSGTRPRLNPLDLAVARPATPSPYPAKFTHTLPSPGLNSAQNSPSRKDNYFNSPRTSSSSPRRSGTLLTPPLTPSSSFNSASTVATESEFGGDGDVVPGTPPDGGSPLTWGKLRLRRKSALDLCHSEDNTIEYGHGIANGRSSDPAEELAALMRRVDLTPRFEKPKFVFGELSEQDVRKVSERDREKEDLEKNATRFLLVHNASSRTADMNIRTALNRCMAARVMRVLRLQPNTIVIVFYDLREAIMSANWLDGKTISELNGGDARLKPAVNGTLDSHLFDTSSAERELPLSVEFITRAKLEKFDKPPAPHDFVGTESALLVEVCADNRPVSHDDVRKVLASLGPLAHFRPASSNTVRAIKSRSRGSQGPNSYHEVFFADYYDSGNATTARQQLNGKMIFHTRLRVCWASEFDISADDDVEKEQPMQDKMPYPVMSYGSLSGSTGIFDLSSPPMPSIPLPPPDSPTPTKGGIPSDFKIRPRSVSASEGTVCPDAPGFNRERGRGQLSPMSPTSHALFFDTMGRVPVYAQNFDRQRSISMGPEERDTPNYQYAHYPFGDPSSSLLQSYQQPMSDRLYMSQPSGYQYAQPYPMDSYGMSLNAAYASTREPWMYPAAPPTPEYLPPPSMPNDNTDTFRNAPPRGFPHGKKHPRGYRRTEREQREPSDAFGRSSDSSFEDALNANFGEPLQNDKAGQISDKNRLNFDMIERGLDTRTTLMIKNIPNKMSDKDLLEFIGRVCPRRIDFFYLRMDFQNGCNVGYGFVNFIDVTDLLHFAKTQLGVKWNMYSSEKVLQMSYANYQGKEALVEKFKNSCIMDEREGWQPKIFYSEGINQGLPEPFPQPTHLRRKERSASNRGALYVPGANHYHNYPHGHHGPPPHHPPSFPNQRYVPRFA